MSSVIEISGKKFHSIKDAVGVVSYSRDHITRLAREGKIRATLIGRQWFVDIDSLKGYSQVAAEEQEIRKRELSEERRRERLLREQIASRSAVQDRTSNRAQKKAKILVAGVVMAGLITGLVVSESQIRIGNSVDQLANTRSADQSSEPVTKDLVVSSYDRTNFDINTTGILLLPIGTSTDMVEIEDYFSDEVEITYLENGMSAVRQTDSERNPDDKEIPFVLVPVKSNSE